MKVGIIGAGAMGMGITQLIATSGDTVLLYDADYFTALKAIETIRTNLHRLAEKGKIPLSSVSKITNQIIITERLQGLGDCECIIEAIVEDLEVKKMIFAELEMYVTEGCVLATNTSSLSITAIAASCRYSTRVLGIHFFNPAVLMPLVEIIPALQTDVKYVQKAIKKVEEWGKTIVIAKDTPGFIVNRIARPFYSEALRIYEEGIAHFSVIDKIMTDIGFKMGPFALMDLIGHDVNYAVTESIWRSTYFEQRYKPSITQKRLVEAGFLGKKAGHGFYNYEKIDDNNFDTEIDDELKKRISKRILVMLINEAYDALYWQIANKEDIDKAMTLGVNYPKGLIRWGEEMGIENVVAHLDALYDIYREDRYRVSPQLRIM